MDVLPLQIACISPAIVCESESLSTLRYAYRAKNIENAPIIKTDSKENVINRLKREVRKLKDENFHLKQKLGYQSNNQLPRLKNRNHDGGKASLADRIAGLHWHDIELRLTNIHSFSRKRRHLRSTRFPVRILSSRCAALVSFAVVCRVRSNGMTSQKIRSHHEILTRENEKLARQLNRRMKQEQGHPHERRVVVVEEEPEVREVNQIIALARYPFLSVSFDRSIHHLLVE